ncbi:unnamed protein product [Didymodactylos carnosus]|nr:unnamed protein product [Didymodactylos carnosus]CAF3559575.1 unnamed protein product [Didymodactylos carnosus]
MMSPIVPLFAEIFMNDSENKHTAIRTSLGVKLFRRYVDDIFVLLENSISPSSICDVLSILHPSTTFTFEQENLNKIAF